MRMWVLFLPFWTKNAETDAVTAEMALVVVFLLVVFVLVATPVVATQHARGH